MATLQSHVIKHPDGTESIDLRYMVTILEQVLPETVIKMFTDEIIKHLMENHLADIISKINFQTVANLAAIELGKRAAKEVED